MSKTDGPAPSEAATLEAMRECFRMIERFAAWGRNLPDAADLAKAREELKRIGYAARLAEVNAVRGALYRPLGEPSALVAAVRSHFAGGPMPENIADALRDEPG